MTRPGPRDRLERLRRWDRAPARTPADIRTRAGTVRQAVTGASDRIDGGNFTRIGTADLVLLFEAYDRQFFSGALSAALSAPEGIRVGFRLSSRMTRAGGKTFRYRGTGGRPPAYEIAISSHLLFANFTEPGAVATVNGVTCRDRFGALQRIFEHELIHLVEFELTGRSSCRSGAFLDRARRVFGHEATTHRLETVQERVARETGVSVGDRVAFRFDGRRLEGRVNRITKRATVLVASPSGEPYTDGGRYDKYYVPLGRLERVY